jgi:hypothetical protein
MPDEMEAFSELLPDGAVPMYGFLIVAWLDEDGTVYDEYRVIGEATTRDALGTLESTKFRISCQQWDVVTRED